MFAHNRYYTATRPKVDGGRRRVASALWMLLAFTAVTGAARAEDPGFPAPTGEASILAGKQLAYVSTGKELPTNVAFGYGDDANLLYVTSGKSLYTIRTVKKGYHLKG